MGKKVFDIPAAQSWIRRWVDSVVFGRYSNQIDSIATGRAVFFVKMKPNCTGIFNIKVTSLIINGAFTLSVTTAAKGNLSQSRICVLSSSIPYVESEGVIYLGEDLEGTVDGSIYVGMKVPFPTIYTINVTAVASERMAFSQISLAPSLNGKSYVAWDIGKVYLNGVAVGSNLTSLNAFHKWTPNYQYSAEDPVFWEGSVYFANPAAIPDAGESPTNAPGKWIQLARSDPPDIDLSEGVDTPQLFHRPSLVISNSTAVKIRKWHRDVGMQYPSPTAKVYHLDDDIRDQDQQSNLNVLTDINPYVTPVLVNKNTAGRDGLTFVPAITKKPFKELPQALFGNFNVLLDLAGNTEQKTYDFWIKFASLVDCYIFKLLFANGGSLHLMTSYGTGKYNELETVTVDNQFYYNEDAGMQYNENDSVSGPHLVYVDKAGATHLYDLTPGGGLPFTVNMWIHVTISIRMQDIFVRLNSKNVFIDRMYDDVPYLQLNINPRRDICVLDEVLSDPNGYISDVRSVEVSAQRLSWAEHELDDNWFVIFSDAASKTDWNLARFFIPVGGMVGQPSDNDGTYNENNVPWKQHDSIPEEEWQSIGELNIGGSNKVKVWKRIQTDLSDDS